MPTKAIFTMILILCASLAVAWALAGALLVLGMCKLAGRADRHHAGLAPDASGEQPPRRGAAAIARLGAPAR